MITTLSTILALFSTVASAVPGPLINGNQINPQTAISIATETVTGAAGLTVTNGVTASSGTFTATGNSQYSLKTSSGINVVAGSVVAPSFVGPLAGNVTGNLTGSVTGAASLNVLKAGDTMTGSLNVSGPNGVGASFYQIAGSTVLSTGGQVSNLFAGVQAGNTSVSGTFNTLVGSSAGNHLTSGAQNTFLGTAGQNATTGSNNTCIGSTACNGVMTGGSNVAVGSAPGGALTSGANNTILGTQAGNFLATGSGNVFLGYTAGYNETGSNKLYIANTATNPALIYGDFSQGYVGIDTQTPSYPLDVHGDIHTDGQFRGAGTGLTGTAASLTAGFATGATSASYLNGGGVGQIPVQTGSGLTGFLPAMGATGIVVGNGTSSMPSTATLQGTASQVSVTQSATAVTLALTNPINVATSGNAATATALAATPSAASSGFLCRGIDASGNCLPAFVATSAVSSSTNPVTSGAMFTALALKAPLASPTFTGTVNSDAITVSAANNITVSGGGELLGLPGTPSGNTAATSKAYVDALVVAASTGVGLQATTPGAAQTGNINVSGTIIAGTALTVPSINSGTMTFTAGAVTANSQPSASLTTPSNTTVPAGGATLFWSTAYINKGNTYTSATSSSTVKATVAGNYLIGCGVGFTAAAISDVRVVLNYTGHQQDCRGATTVTSDTYINCQTLAAMAVNDTFYCSTYSANATTLNGSAGFLYFQKIW